MNKPNSQSEPFEIASFEKKDGRDSYRIYIRRHLPYTRKVRRKIHQLHSWEKGIVCVLDWLKIQEVKQNTTTLNTLWENHIFGAL